MKNTNSKNFKSILLICRSINHSQISIHFYIHFLFVNLSINPKTISIMKKSFIYLFIGVFTMGLLAFVKVSDSPKKSFNESFAKVLTDAKAYTLEVAEAMPADKYNFKPNDSVRSFGEQMAHIGMSNKMILTIFIKGEKMDMDPEKGKMMEQKIGASKEECIKMIGQSFDDAIATLKGMDEKALAETFVFMFSPDKPEFTKEEGFAFLRDHGTHHRGQAIIYLRMQGVKSPSYRAF